MKASDVYTVVILFLLYCLSLVGILACFTNLKNEINLGKIELRGDVVYKDENFVKYRIYCFITSLSFIAFFGIFCIFNIIFYYLLKEFLGNAPHP